jgi:hypothetical protein
MSKIGRKDEAGNLFAEWINNQAYVRRNVIPLLLTYPKFFDLMPNPAELKAMLKELLELHPLSITGLQAGLTVETEEHAIGGAGEMQEEVTDVKRARSTVNFTFKEKAGKAIGFFLDMYIRYGIMDPDMKRPLVSNLLPNGSVDGIGGMYTPEYYTFSMLFIEPDITHTTVYDAWLISNMYPKSNGDRVGSRDIRAAGESPELSIDMAGFSMCNENVRIMAKAMLANLTTLKHIPDLGILVPTDKVDPGILAASNIGNILAKSENGGTNADRVIPDKQ